MLKYKNTYDAKKIGIIHDFLISQRLTMGVGGKVSHFAEAYSEKQFEELYRFSLENNLDFYIFGGGSNLVMNDSYKKCLMVAILFKGMSIINQNSDNVIIKVAAGENWDSFVKYCINKKYWGCENLSLIPGLVGATAIQNVGAFGQEVKNIILSVRCFDLTQKKYCEFNNNQCNFGYRKSIFNTEYKNKYVICSITFRLSLIPKPNLKRIELAKLRLINKNSVFLQTKIRDTIIHHRTNGKNLPNKTTLGSAGTFFKAVVVKKHKNLFKIIFKIISNIGIKAAILILLSSIKNRSAEGYKISSKLIIKLSHLSNLKIGSFFLLPSNPSCIVSEINKNPSSNDLTKMIKKITKHVYDNTSIKLDIEPELIDFNEIS